MTLEEAIVAQMTAYRAIKSDSGTTALGLARDIYGLPISPSTADVRRALHRLQRKGIVVKGESGLWMLCKGSV